MSSNLNLDDSAIQQGAAATANPTSSTAQVSAILENPLRKFASFNTVISLEVSTRNNYNYMMATQSYSPANWDVICKTGGKGSGQGSYGFSSNEINGQDSGSNIPNGNPVSNVKNSSTQNPSPELYPNGFFAYDLYLDDVEILTLCSLQQINRGSNAVQTEFTIVEPYGMSFLDTLYDYSAYGLREENYLQIPYLLKIEFEGILDDGSFVKLADQTKIIPIVITSMNIKANSMGATYKVTAIAHNDLAHTEQYGRIPAMASLGQGTNTGSTQSTSTTDIDPNTNIPVSATQGMTVQGYLDELMQSINTYYTQSQQKAGISAVDKYFAVCLDERIANSKISIIDDQITEIGSIQTALHDIDVQETKIKPAAVQTVDTGFGNAPNYSAVNEAQNQIATLEDQKQQLQKQLDQLNKNPTALGGNNDVSLLGKSIVFTVGSNILDCINTLIMASDYIQGQIKFIENIKNQATQYATLGSIDAALEQIAQLTKTPLDWFIVSSTVDYNAEGTDIGYSSAGLRRYTRRIRYNITPHRIINCASIYSGNDNPKTRTTKQYEYIFTGNNSEILNWDLDFNVAYFHNYQVSQQYAQQATGAPNAADLQIPPKQSSATLMNPPVNVSATNAGTSYQISSSSPKKLYGIGPQSPDLVKTSDIASTLYAPGQMVQLDLEIQGDPDYIKQDGVFIDLYNLTHANTNTNSYNKNPSTSLQNILDNPIYSPAAGSSSFQPKCLLYDTGEIYMQVQFKIPEGLNLDTGLVTLEPNSANQKAQSRNVFSGYYKILTVTNKFSKGVFTQKITAAKYDETKAFSTDQQQSGYQNLRTYLQNFASNYIAMILGPGQSVYQQVAQKTATLPALPSSAPLPSRASIIVSSISDLVTTAYSTTSTRGPSR